MKKGNNILNVLRYLCLSFAIGLGLVTIVGTGGGGGGDTNSSIKDEIKTKTRQILPDEEQIILENSLDNASSKELEDLDNAIDDFLDSVSAHQEEEQGLSISATPSLSVTDEANQIIGDIKSLLSDIFGNINLEDGKRVFLNAGMGFNREVLGGGGGSLIGVVIVGAMVSIEGGFGIGTAYDFLNFSKYEYSTRFCAGSGGIAIGAKGQLGVDVNLIATEGWMFGFQKDQQYSGGPSIGEGLSIGVSGALGWGLGLSGSFATSRSLEGSCSFSGCIPFYELVPGEPTGQYAFSYAVKISGTVVSAGAETNISVKETYSCAKSPFAVQNFVDESNPSKIDTITAGFKMAASMIICNGGVTGSALTLPAGATAILYGLLYDKNLIDQQGLQFDLEYRYPISQWIGGIALSPDDSTLYVAYWTDTSSDKVEWYSTQDPYNLIDYVAYGRCHRDVAVSDNNQYIFTTTYYSSNVSRFDLWNNKAQSTLPTTSWPQTIAMTPDRSKMVVFGGMDGSSYDMGNDALSIFDISNNNFYELNTIPLSDYLVGYKMAFTENGNYGYFLTGREQWGSGPAKLYEISMTSYQVRFVVLPSQKCYGVALAFNKLYISDLDNSMIRVYDRQTLTEIDQWPLSNPPDMLAIPPDRSGLYVLFRETPEGAALEVLDLSSGEKIGGYQLDCIGPYGADDIEFSSDGKKVYISCFSGGVLVLNVNSN